MAAFTADSIAMLEVVRQRGPISLTHLQGLCIWMAATSVQSRMYALSSKGYATRSRNAHGSMIFSAGNPPPSRPLPRHLLCILAAQGLDTAHLQAMPDPEPQDDDDDDDDEVDADTATRPSVQPEVLAAVAHTPARHVHASVLAINRPPVVRAGSLDALRLASRQFGGTHHHHAADALGVIEAGQRNSTTGARP